MVHATLIIHSGLDVRETYYTDQGWKIKKRNPSKYVNIKAGIKQEIDVYPSKGAFGVYRGVAMRHDFSVNGDTFEVEWDMPASGTGVITWRQTGGKGTLKNCVFYEGKINDFHRYHLMVKYQGDAIYKKEVEDGVLNTFQDIVGFVPVIGDGINMVLYAAQGKTEEAIMAGIGFGLGGAGKALSIAAKLQKFEKYSKQMKKMKNTMALLDDTKDINKELLKGNMGDAAKETLLLGAKKGIKKGGKKGGRKVKDHYKKKHDGVGYDFDVNGDGIPMKKNKFGKMNDLRDFLMDDEFGDMVTDFGVNVAHHPVKKGVNGIWDHSDDDDNAAFDTAQDDTYAEEKYGHNDSDNDYGNHSDNEYGNHSSGDYGNNSGKDYSNNSGGHYDNHSGGGYGSHSGGYYSNHSGSDYDGGSGNDYDNHYNNNGNTRKKLYISSRPCTAKEIEEYGLNDYGSD